MQLAGDKAATWLVYEGNSTQLPISQKLPDVGKHLKATGNRRLDEERGRRDKEWQRSVQVLK